MQIVVVILLTIIIMFIFNQSNSVEGFEFDDLLLTDYRNGFTCSKWLDELPKYARLNSTGGTMYVSNRKPMEGDFKQVECPEFMNGSNIICYRII